MKNADLIFSFWSRLHPTVGPPFSGLQEAPSSIHGMSIYFVFKKAIKNYFQDLFFFLDRGTAICTRREPPWPALFFTVARPPKRRRWSSAARRPSTRSNSRAAHNRHFRKQRRPAHPPMATARCPMFEFLPNTEASFHPSEKFLF